MTKMERRSLHLATVAFGAAWLVQPALAQDQPPSAQEGYRSEDIIVTARKREESIMRAPVVAAVITGEKIEALKVVDFKTLASVMPGLQISESLSNMYV